VLGRKSEALPFGGLPGKQEGFGELALAADLERAEILIPESFGRLRLGFAPQLQLIQVFGFDVALAQALEEWSCRAGGKSVH